MSKVTPAGATSTFNGGLYLNGDGGLAFDTSGNLYQANYNSGNISKINPANSGSTFATGLSTPLDLAFDTAGNLYTANSGAGTIVKITPAGVVSTFATIGAGTSDLAFDNIYPASGTFTSAVIDLANNANFTTLDYTTTLPATTTITMDVRAGDTPTLSGAWTTGIASGGSISALGAHRYIQYRANLSTTDTAVSPTLDSVTVNYTQYALSGDLTSSVYDTEAAANLVSNVMWSASGTDGASSTVKFQVRSASTTVLLDTAPWCGPATACDGTGYFTVSTGVVDGIVSGHPLNTGGNDRYLQYKMFLTSGGNVTPTVTSVTLQYVVNAPPVITNATASQVSDSGSANYSKVSFSFDASDPDTTTGTATPYTVTPTLYEYSTNSGSSWATISSGALGANAFSAISIASNTSTTTTTVVWDPAGTSVYANNTAEIRVTLSDGEAANYSASGTSSTFTLDTVVPVITTATLDSSTGGTAVGTIALTATDNSTLQYRLCNDNAFPSADAQGNSCAWTTLAASPISTTTIAWIPTGSPSNEAVYLQVRDLYGNVTARTIVAPATLTDFTYADASNTAGGVYREFLSWSPFVATTSSAFASYKVYHSINNFATAGTLLTTITDSSINYYVHNITTATSSLQYYRIATVNTNGDISNFTAVLSDVPDGSGGVDATPPYIPLAGIATPTVGNSSANITFSTYTDSSLAVGELATSTVFYASYSGAVPGTCPGTPKVVTSTYTVNHSVYLTGLTPSTQYYFCIIAKDITGNVSTATTAVGGTFTTVSGPVITNVTERELTDVSALIFWNTDTVSDSKVYFSTTSSGVNGATPTTGAVVTTAGTDGAYQHQVGLTGLTAGQTYYYKVSSTDTATSSLTTTNDNSGQYYSFVTLKDTTPPTITGIATPVLSSDAAVIVWQTDEPATSQVQWGTASSSYTRSTVTDSTKSIYHIVTLSSGTVDMLSAVQTLTPVTTYHFIVRSSDVAGNIAQSGDQTLTTPVSGNVTVINVVNSASASDSRATPDTTPPSISNVAVSGITPFSATVKFDTDEDTVAEVEAGASTSYGQTASSFDWRKTHEVKLRGLTLGTEYHFRAKAADKAGNIGIGTDQTFTTRFLTEGLDSATVDNIEAFQKEIEAAIESILPSLVPPFVSKPQITEITESGAKVTFKTNIKAFPVVVYADDGSYDETKDNPYVGEISDTMEKTIEHNLTLEGLKGNTKYHIQARAFSLPKVIGKSADVTFITKASKIAGSIVERKKDSFTVVWTTGEPTSTIVEYKNLKNGITQRKTDDAKKTSHSMKIENLPPGTAYEVYLSGLTEQGNIAEAGSPLSVTTSRDVTAPTISGFKVDNALVPGRTDRIQTIVSWITDEPGNATVYYEEGAGNAGDTKELANKNETLDSYTVGHSIILPNLKPGTIYRLKVTSRDDSGNLGSFGPRTIITPKQTESITDIIFKNFEDSFKFLRKI